MSRVLFVLLAGIALGGCTVLDPSADLASPAPYADKERITGSHLPARNHNASGTKVIEMNALDRQEMLQPKATPLSGS